MKRRMQYLITSGDIPATARGQSVTGHDLAGRLTETKNKPNTLKLSYLPLISVSVRPLFPHSTACLHQAPSTSFPQHSPRSITPQGSKLWARTACKWLGMQSHEAWPKDRELSPTILSKEFSWETKETSRNMFRIKCLCLRLLNLNHLSPVKQH